MKPTQEQAITWAREAGWQYAENDNSGYEPLWRAMRFAYEAGRKDENEACAEVCDEKVDAEYATGKVDHNEMGWTQACAIAIRARREQ